LGSTAARALSVDLAAVADAYDLDAHSFVLNIGDDAVIADAVFPVVAQGGTNERFADAARVVEYGYALAEEFNDAAGNLFVELVKFFLSLFFKLNQPGQVASPLHRS
jgi:hypothetical protein